jgi:hypothetical protein
MHAYANGPQSSDDAYRRAGFERCSMRGTLNWRPLEIVAMVLGFIVFWPIGLAILIFKIWQRRAGYPGTLADFAEEKFKAGAQFEERMRAKWREHWETGMWNCGHRRREGADRQSADRPWGGFGSGPRPTGNAAFDDWRAAELARIEEERRKLWAAEREFADYMDGLKRARDREEFDRFMNQRRSSPPPAGPAPEQPQA